MLDPRWHTFLVLCETMNYTRAAERLCLTQPAVTHHIHYLEAHYGCRLFTYQGKTLRLTPRIYTAWCAPSARTAMKKTRAERWPFGGSG